MKAIVDRLDCCNDLFDKVHTMFNLLRCLVFVVLVSFANTSMPHPWYETLPAVALDYKVHIDAGKEDCYFQYVNAGATFYVNFQVHDRSYDDYSLNSDNHERFSSLA